MVEQVLDIKTLQKEEALKRLLALNLHENVVRDFKSGRLNLSERARLGRGVFGILYWLNEEESGMVRNFEEKFGAVVYHVLKYQTEFGVQYAFLYVSANSDDWERDWEEAKEDMATSYVTDGGWVADIGLIGIKESGGGLVRTW